MAQIRVDGEQYRCGGNVPCLTEFTQKLISLQLASYRSTNRIATSVRTFARNDPTQTKMLLSPSPLFVGDSLAGS